MNKKLLNVDTVAIMLDCSKRNVYHLIKNKKLKAERLSAHGIRITEEEVKRFLSEFK